MNLPFFGAVTYLGPRKFLYTAVYRAEIDADEDECFICREEYNWTSNETCVPIRLALCKHIVGHRCFNRWFSSGRHVCPYCQQRLKMTLKNWFLNWFDGQAHSTWFQYFEAAHLVKVRFFEPAFHWLQPLRKAYASAANGTLTFDEALLVFGSMAFSRILSTYSFLVILQTISWAAALISCSNKWGFLGGDSCSSVHDKLAKGAFRIISNFVLVNEDFFFKTGLTIVFLAPPLVLSAVLLLTGLHRSKHLVPAIVKVVIFYALWKIPMMLWKVLKSRG